MSSLCSTNHCSNLALLLWGLVLHLQLVVQLLSFLPGNLTKKPGNTGYIWGLQHWTPTVGCKLCQSIAYLGCHLLSKGKRKWVDYLLSSQRIDTPNKKKRTSRWIVPPSLHECGRWKDWNFLYDPITLLYK